MKKSSINLEKQLSKYEIYGRYGHYLETSGIKLPTEIWFLISIISGFALGAIVGILRLDFGILVGISAIDLMLGIPYFIAKKKVGELENSLPDALRQMATTFKAGGTYEYALKEIVNADYGLLSKQFEIVLRETQSGSTLNDALLHFAERTDSTLVKRTITIMIDAAKTGASLSTVFEEVSEDIRGIHNLVKERAAKTLMQAMFIIAAGALVAPAIFGIVLGIISFLIQISASTGIQSGKVIAGALYAQGVIETMMMVYIVAEALASSAIISTMRDGSFSKTIIYFPAILLVAYTVVNIARYMLVMVTGSVT